MKAVISMEADSILNQIQWSINDKSVTLSAYQLRINQPVIQLDKQSLQFV